MNKRLQIPKGLENEVKGFEDLIDSFLEEKEEASRGKISEKKDYDGHSAYNFLELEKMRVKKLSSMISKKIPNVIEHDISADLIEKFTTYNYDLRHKIISDIKEFDSLFNKNLRLLYNKVLKNK